MDSTIENMINSIDLSAPVPEYEPMRQYYYLKACRQIVKEKENELNRPLKAVVSTFGCQMNARDSEKLLGILKDIGYVESDDEESADFVIYNTCTVRENANLRVYGRLGQLKKVKRNNHEMIIAMCGCMMQEPDEVAKIRSSYRFVDIVFGTHNIFKLAELLYQAFTKKYKQINERIGKNQFLVPYLMSSHPGSTMKEAVELAEYLRDLGYMPEQVQAFYPTPSTISTCMYYTGVDPRTMEKVYVPVNPHEKAMQRALIQYRNPKNYDLVLEALKVADRMDLVGYDKKCLIRPRQQKQQQWEKTHQQPQNKKPRKKKAIRNVHKKKNK